MSPHPIWGTLTSRTRILLGFTDTATVAEANAAIQAASVEIIGGLPNLETLLVSAEDTSDFSGLTTALDTLRADPAVDFAAMSPEIGLDEVPRPASDKTSKTPTGNLRAVGPFGFLLLAWVACLFAGRLCVGLPVFGPPARGRVLFGGWRLA